MKFLSAEILELTAHPTLDPGGTVSADWLLGRMGGVRLSHRKLWDLRQSWTILSLSLSLLSPPLPGWGGGLTISPDYTDCDEVLSRMACWPHISHICCPILVLSPTVESWAAVARPVLFWLAVPSTCHSATPGDNTLGDITHRTSGRVLTWPAEIGRLWPLLRHFSQSVRGRGGRGRDYFYAINLLLGGVDVIIYASCSQPVWVAG